jgi:hypothetical protein
VIVVAVNVPAPTSNVELNAAVGSVNVTVVVTLRENELLIIIPLLAAGLLNVTLLQALFASTVTVTPELIVTASAAVGTAALPAAPPTAVAQIGSPQLPLATAKRCANAASEKNNEQSKNKKTDNSEASFVLNVQLKPERMVVFMESDSIWFVFYLLGTVLIRLDD